MRNFDYPQVGTALIVVKGDKILLHKRKGNHFPRYWGCPGGHLEKFETFEDCVKRELLEECGSGLEIGSPRYYCTTNCFYKEENKHYVCIFMIADWISGEPIVMEPNKCECWKWFDWNNLPKNIMSGLQELKNNHKNPIQELLIIQ